jgi:epsilon-lactone hydrolase
MKTAGTALTCFLFFLIVGCRSNNDPLTGYYYVPSTLSKDAQKVLRTFPHKDTLVAYPGENDTAGWRKYWDYNEKRWLPYNDTVVMTYHPEIKDTVLGGTPVLDIRPADWKHRNKVLIYVHGGAYTLFSARSMLIGAVPVADATGLRIISVNYTNPPRKKFEQILNQVIQVYQSLLQQGYSPADIGIYGDSAGGGLSAGAVLKIRDQGIPMPAVIVLVSPWSDITETGDTYYTLKDKDPILAYGNSLNESALAYAPEGEHKNPYVSPVYADYSKGFPPTLIQGGSKEIFMSNFIRQYQAIDQSGIPVKLDLYEGMWHVFQEINYAMPESKIAHKKFRDWVYQYLGIGTRDQGRGTSGKV